MQNKELKFGLNAKREFKKGIDELANAVKTTLGPQGQCVIIGNYINGQPHVTKDGVTVAKNIQFSDNYMNAGAQLIREAALKTVSQVGDSTTTSTVLAQEFINRAMILLEAGENPCKLKNQINILSKKIIDGIKSFSKPVEGDDIENIATISANNDPEIGKLIADAFKKITEDGVITVEESNDIETSIDIISGMQFERGYEAPHFITDNVKNECILENPYIFITEEKIEHVRDIVPILEFVADQGKPILFIAEDFDSEVIENFKINKLQNILKICAVKAPSFGEYRKSVLDDLAILTGGVNLTYDSGLTPNNATPDMLGICDKIIITKTNTTIIGGKTSPELIQERVDSLKNELKNVEPESFLFNFIKQRIAKLVGGVAVIHVGGTTEMEMKERKDRVDDAIAATKAATEEGIVAGGGITYLKCLSLIDPKIKKTICNIDECSSIIELNSLKEGIEILKGISSIWENIMNNAGFNTKDFYSKIDPQKNIGVDAKTGKIGNMINCGIINPAKAERLAFENAISVLNLFLSTNCIIVDEKQPPFFDINN